MFKWRSYERNKITAVFKFQFHVTQVAEYGVNGLLISIVPADNGKPTAKLEKCVIKDNNCYWENPVYETVKLFQDPKSAKILERIYYFLVSTSTGANKGSLVGEFCVNIAEYIGASAKPCSISFPFKNSNSNSHLHVSIQRILENDNQRVEGNGSPQIKVDNRSLRQYFSNDDVEESFHSNSIECLPDQPLRKTASDQARLHGIQRVSIGSDITLSSSDSSSGLNTPRVLEVKGINTIKDQTSNGLGYQDQQRSQWELAIVPVNDAGSVYSMNSPRDVFSSDRSLMVVDDSVEKLKTDLVALSRRAEVSELELQTLRKQIVKECKRGQDLLRELTSVKEERNALKGECEKLKASGKCADDLRVRSKFQFEGDPWALLEEMKEELTYEKDLNTNLRIQLQKTQDSNAELIFAVQDLEEMLEKNDRGAGMPNRLTSGESAVEIEESMLKCQSDDDEEQKALEELVKQHSDAHESYLLEQKVMDLCSEIEMYRRDKDELEMQMEQLALDYEILKQENHEYYSRLEQTHLQDQLKMHCDGPSSYLTVKELQAQIEKLENDLKEKAHELSDCLVTMKDLEAQNQSLEEELRKQSDVCKADIESITSVKVQLEQRAARAEEALTQSDSFINELEIKIENLKNEQKKHLEELSGSLATINELETCNQNLRMELDQQEQRFEAVACAKMEQEQRAMQAEEAVVWRDNTISELETRIEKLENELKTCSEESSGTLATVRELETHIQNLEEEIEKQAEGFEADLEVVTRAKVEQEQRAIRAEEALRLIKWKNTKTAARIQDEFRRLSTQMQSSFEANEKLASKALTEASELRMQNLHLQYLLQRTNEELQSAKHEYETKLHELYSQVNLKSNQIEQMESEIQEKSKLMENQIIQAEELQNALSAQEDLRAERVRLISENKSLSEQEKQEEVLRSEVEKMKSLIKEKDQLLQKENVDSTIALVKEVAGKSLEELNVLRFQQDKKDQMVQDLQSKMEELRAQCDNLKHSLYEDESEKEKLRTQVVQLKADLKKKDESILNIEKKLKENSGREVVHDKSKDNFKNTKPEGGQRGHKEAGSKEMSTLKERIKLLEGQIKSKEAALETSANAFLAKEKKLHGIIEELEVRLEELRQCHGAGQDFKAKQENVSAVTQVCNNVEVTSADDRPEEGSDITEKSSLELNREISSDTQPAVSDNNSEEQQKFDILLKEMVLLKEKNNSMEKELLEMQERYSEISLKFAEVEGERQQLVMRVRSLKNSRKS